jgi:hypothetical protein
VFGIRLVRLLDVLPVTAVENAVGVTPRSLLVTAPRLEAVDQVLLNGMLSPTFAVFSKTQLICEVPESLDQAIITDVAVLSSVPTMTERSLVELGVGARVTRASGSQRLLQTFVRLLLRTSGTNIFHPDTGGSLLRSVGGVMGSRAAADVAVSIGLVKQQIIAAQTSYGNIPPTERLLSAELVAMNEDPGSATVACTVVLTTHDRRRSAATLIS